MIEYTKYTIAYGFPYRKKITINPRREACHVLSQREQCSPIGIARLVALSLYARVITNIISRF
ncbi:hypothetical protein RIEGSTA812A_PEG_582 [invertebrate metagenome]|uniref:Uncharacterized protein n=1 Tax=invertebrate metagenome TaxID=1711999 RepID=A0A484H5B4_9ZZZZ